MDLVRMEKGRLKERITSLFRSSLASTCSTLTSNSLSESVHEPTFVSHRTRDFFRSLDSSSAVVDLRLQLHHQKDLPPPAPLQVSLRCDGCRPTMPTNLVKHRAAAAAAAAAAGERKRAAKKKAKAAKLLTNGYGFDSSSSGSDMEDDDRGLLFSSDEERRRRRLRHREEPAETLFSSKSFSSSSSEFYYASSRSRKKKKKNKKAPVASSSSTTSHRRVARTRHASSYSNSGEGYRQVVATEEGGFAVVKQSRDPYGDFRSSVLEMIMEKQALGGRELQQLLHAYLSLNSPRHHPVILQVFSDIHKVLFSNH